MRHPLPALLLGAFTLYLPLAELVDEPALCSLAVTPGGHSRNGSVLLATATRDSALAARFWLGNDNVLRVEQTTRLAGGRSLVILGQRLSKEVITCDW